MTQIDPIICPVLGNGGPLIVHGFFTRSGGVSTGLYKSLNIGPSSADISENVSTNRRAIAQHLGFGDEDLVSPWQHHSTHVLVATDNWGENRPKADAIVTKTPQLPIAIVTADCGPVLFADAKNRIVAAAHAGWRGATQGILESTIDKMIEQGAARENIRATLGPTISGENYEVGPEFVDNLMQIDQANSAYLTPSTNPGHAYFDLPNYIVERLTKSGIDARWTGQCTYAQESQFFSYRRMTHRREKDYGRQISAIAIRKK